MIIMMETIKLFAPSFSAEYCFSDSSDAPYYYCGWHTNNMVRIPQRGNRSHDGICSSYGRENRKLYVYLFLFPNDSIFLKTVKEIYDMIMLNVVNILPVIFCPGYMVDGCCVDNLLFLAYVCLIRIQSLCSSIF